MLLTKNKRGGQKGNNNGFQKGNKYGAKKHTLETKKKIGLANNRPKIKLVCNQCFIEFLTHPCNINQKFCSKECYDKSDHFWLRGEKNHKWQGGIYTSLRHKIKVTKKYKHWRFSIFKRDNFTCLFCKKSKEVSGKLEADHYPRSFASLLVLYEIKSIKDAKNCEELWNINNGRTLCRDCHKTTDTYGGKEMRRLRTLRYVMSLPLGEPILSPTASELGYILG